MVTYAKISPRMMKSRDIAGNAEEEVCFCLSRLFSVLATGLYIVLHCGGGCGSVLLFDPVTVY